MRTTFSIARDTMVALFTLACASTAAAAQDASFGRFEVRPFVGAFIPAGSHEGSLNNGASIGLQGAYSFSRYIAAVATVA